MNFAGPDLGVGTIGLKLAVPQFALDFDEGTLLKGSSAHSALTTIVEDGKQISILRDNMPFGRAAHGEFGTYFIGYSRSPHTIEQMLENMFVGRPPGNYDRLLEFSRAVTGNLFLAPSLTLLEAIGEDQPAVLAAPVVVPPAARRRFAGYWFPQRRKFRMNNLYRELAPISDSAWAQIEEETARTFKRYLAGRRVVDVRGPAGADLSAVGTGHLRRLPV